MSVCSIICSTKKFNNVHQRKNDIQCYIFLLIFSSLKTMKIKFYSYQKLSLKVWIFFIFGYSIIIFGILILFLLIRIICHFFLLLFLISLFFYLVGIRNYIILFLNLHFVLRIGKYFLDGKLFWNWFCRQILIRSLT